MGEVQRSMIPSSAVTLLEIPLHDLWDIDPKCGMLRRRTPVVEVVVIASKATGSQQG